MIYVKLAFLAILFCLLLFIFHKIFNRMDNSSPKKGKFWSEVLKATGVGIGLLYLHGKITTAWANRLENKKKKDGK